MDRIHENEKKRKYNSRVTEIEQGTFTPLVFTTTGGMADECLRYHSRLAELLSAKKQESYATTISWVRAKVSFAILRSALLCLRGSRTPLSSAKSSRFEEARRARWCRLIFQHARKAVLGFSGLAIAQGVIGKF